MPLPANTPLAPHFTAGEMGADNPNVTAVIVANLRYTAVALEKFRSVLGVPMRITSGFRTPEHNSEIGGSATSDHPNGLAVDTIPQGLSLYAAYRRLTDAAAAGQLPAFDQIIYYPADGHLHIGFGSRMRGQSLIKLGESYATITENLASKLTGFVAGAARVATDAIDTLSKETGVAPPVILLILGAVAVIILLRGIT